MIRGGRECTQVDVPATEIAALRTLRGRGSREDHGAYWVQNNKSDGYTSIASRIAATAIQDSEATISWGGEVESCEVEEVRIGCSASCSADTWEEKIAEVAEEQEAIMFTDGSKGKDGRVAGDWAKDTLQAGPRNGGRYLGEGATVWDGEIAGMAEALERGPRGRGMLILADSMAAIQAVKKAGRTGKARSRELVSVMKEVRKRGNVRFAWVKAHVGTKEQTRQLNFTPRWLDRRSSPRGELNNS